MGSIKDEIHSGLSKEHREIAEWIYETTKKPAFASIMFGIAVAVVRDRPSASWWDVMAEVRQRWDVDFFSDLDKQLQSIDILRSAKKKAGLS